MKASAFIATLVATVTFLSAHSAPLTDRGPCDTFFKCREFTAETIKHLPAATQVEYDLVHGQWTLETPSGLMKSFYFNADGNTGILIRNDKGHASYTTAAWKVDIVDGHSELTLKENNRKKRTFRVEQTCEGLKLIDKSNRTALHLEYEPLKESICLRRIKEQLTGEWTNVTYFKGNGKCENAEGSYLTYLFSPDGTYDCNYGSRKTHITKKGNWEISKDGQFLLLHEDGEKVPESKVIRIAQVDEHGLILEKVMTSDEVSEFFCAQTDTFAFIK